MTDTSSELAPFAEELERVLTVGDVGRFEEYLRDRYLPVLGGDVTPAEILGRTLELLPDFSTSAFRTTQFLAHILADEASVLRQNRARLDVRRRAILLSAFQLSSSLPADVDLAAALRDLLAVLRSGGKDAFGNEAFEFWLAVWRALARQQIDGSLRNEWLALFAVPSEEGAWTPERRTLLLEAWRGLLRIPPCAAAQAAGEVIDFDSVEQGLLAMENAVRGRTGGASLLRYALDILCFSFPRSGEFWITRLETRIARWPELLQVEVCNAWPTLKEVLQREKSVADSIEALYGELSALGITRNDAAVLIELFHQVDNTLAGVRLPGRDETLKLLPSVERLSPKIEQLNLREQAGVAALFILYDRGISPKISPSTPSEG